MKVHAKIFLLFLMVLVSLSCNKNNGEYIKIGYIGPLTGEAAYYGLQPKTGVELAVEEINNNGGINGKKLKIVYEDDQLKPELGVAALKRLINLEKVQVVIQAAGSSVMLAEAPVAEKNKVVLISPTCSNPKLKDAGKFIFRTWPSDDFQGKVLARFATRKLNAKKAAILAINNDYGTGLLKEFGKTFNRNGKITANEFVSTGQKDVKTILSKIESKKPDLIFLALQAKEAATALIQCRELGININKLAPEACFSNDLIKWAGTAAEGLYVSAPAWDPEQNSPMVSAFVKAYKMKFGKMPDAFAAAGYETIKVLAKAMEGRPYDGDEIRKALVEIKDYKGIMGFTQFTPDGGVEMPYNIYIIKDGKFVLLEKNWL